MDKEKVISIYRDGGFSINKKHGHYFTKKEWVNHSFPFLLDIPLNKALVDSLKWEHPLSVIKIESKRTNTYEFILKTDNYSLDIFTMYVRNRIRKSLRDCEFRRPELDDLLHFGFAINKQTMERQDRSEWFSDKYKCWEKFITSFYINNDIIILGAYIADKMVAYVIVYDLMDKFVIINPYFDKDASSSAPMNGLIYTLVNQLIKDHGPVTVSYGIESFIPMPNLNRFKQNLLFEKIPATRIYIINPLLIPFVRVIIYTTLHFIKRKTIRNTFLRDLIRLYQGHRLLYNELNNRGKGINY